MPIEKLKCAGGWAFRCCRAQRRRGVAQPGRAPGSGPGGRRFKSSLPDHFFSAIYNRVKVQKCDPLVTHQGGQFHFHAALLSSALMEASSRIDGEMPANQHTVYIKEFTFFRTPISH